MGSTMEPTQLTPQIILETWIVLGVIFALVMASGGGALLFLRLWGKYRTLNATRETEIGLREKAAAEEAVRWKGLEDRIETIEQWRLTHVTTCSNEHQEIRDSIDRAADLLGNKIERFEVEARDDRTKIHERINNLGNSQSEIKGALETLLKFTPAKEQS